MRLTRAVTLDDEDIEAVAARVVELLHEQPGATGRLVDAATLARTLNVDRDWVYARARELGAVRLGAGPKARLRFDIARARAALAASGRSTRLPRTGRGAGGAALAGSGRRLVYSSSRGGLACERGPCNAPFVRSRWPGGCTNTPGPGTGGIFRCKLSIRRAAPR